MNPSNNLVFGVVLIIVFGVAGFFFGRSTVNPVIIAGDTIRTTEIEYRDTSLGGRDVTPKIYIVHDTVNTLETLTEHRVDTLLVFRDTSLSTGYYAAKMDTTAQDSSYSLAIFYKSDKPLSKYGKFDYDLRIRNKTIYERETVYLKEPKSLWDHIKPSIHFGAGYGFLQEKFEINIGIGISIVP